MSLVNDKTEGKVRGLFVGISALTWHNRGKPHVWWLISVI